MLSYLLTNTAIAFYFNAVQPTRTRWLKTKQYQIIKKGVLNRIKACQQQ